jgi:hypothetical protein
LHNPNGDYEVIILHFKFFIVLLPVLAMPDVEEFFSHMLRRCLKYLGKATTTDQRRKRLIRIHNLWFDPFSEEPYSRNRFAGFLTFYKEFVRAGKKYSEDIMPENKDELRVSIRAFFPDELPITEDSETFSHFMEDLEVNLRKHEPFFTKLKTSEASIDEPKFWELHNIIDEKFVAWSADKTPKYGESDFPYDDA